MPNPENVELDGQIEVDNNEIHFVRITVGVPHVVIKLDESPDPLKLEKVSKGVRADKSFQPQGANVTYYFKKSDRCIDALTFERGVEGFTLSCGTGAVAAAWAARGCEWTEGPVDVVVPGGRLSVRWDRNASKTRLAGESHRVSKSRCYL